MICRTNARSATSHQSYSVRPQTARTEISIPPRTSAFAGNLSGVVVFGNLILPRGAIFQSRRWPQRTGYGRKFRRAPHERFLSSAGFRGREFSSPFACYGSAGASPVRLEAADPTARTSCRTHRGRPPHGDLFIEAKLTEAGFPSAPRLRVERYRDFSYVFDTKLLPQTAELYFHYQLIRGVLSVFAEQGIRYCLICDARRPDLIDAWFSVASAVRLPLLRSRLQLITWQEIPAAPLEIHANVA